MLEEQGVLEEKLTTLADQLEELKDLELVNKLDIVNLKNEIEQLKYTVLSISPETDKRIRELVELSKNIETLQQIKSLKDDVNGMKYQLQKLQPEMLQDVLNKIRSAPSRPQEQRCVKCGSALSLFGKYCGKCGQKI